MKVWITKHALTQGIYEREVSLTSNPTMVQGPGSLEYYHSEGKEWHRTRELAVSYANYMREVKIKSLQKSLAKFVKPFV